MPPQVTPSAEARFEFGRNWARFLSILDDERIAAAQGSLQALLPTADFRRLTFLDAGSGSGLFSLAAYRLGAAVTSFDIDPESVACTRELKRRFDADEAKWTVRSGSLTDSAFLSTLGEFDVVYCWGVVHHTGCMWQSLDNLLRRVRPGGTVVLAIYNDQQYISRAWRAVKRIYQISPRFLRPVLIAAIGLWNFLKRAAVTVLACAIRMATLRNPFVPVLNWVREEQGRGMHGWYDLVDWVGGWPYECARPEEVFRFVRDRGFALQDLVTTLGYGCNQFVFTRDH